MGLFLGASVVTVFEVLDLMLYSIALRQAAKQNKKKRKHDPKASADSDPNAFNSLLKRRPDGFATVNMEVLEMK